MKIPALLTAAFALVATPLAGGLALVVSSSDPHPPGATATVEIPPVLLARYRSESSCPGVDWTILAAIGWVESRHANNQINPSTGTLAGPPIHGYAPVGPDTDNGQLDHDPTVDWATGLMQLTPTTWTANATRASNQPAGPADIGNAWDQIATANQYLCQLLHHAAGDLRRAVGAYNCGLAAPDTCGARYTAQVLTKAATYSTGGADLPAVLDGDVAVVVATALAQVGKPYVFGAQGPDAFDCSGLVAYAYHAAGIELPAYTFALIHHGTAVPVDQIQPGDLIFTRGGVPPEDYGHVAIAITPTLEVVAPRTGLNVTTTPIQPDHVQAVRRIIQPTGREVVPGSVEVRW